MAEEAPRRLPLHHDLRLRELEHDHRELELQVTGSLAEIKVVLSQLAGDMNKGIAELKNEVADVKEAVSAGALADVDREARIRQLESATKESKERRETALKWLLGIIASLATTGIGLLIFRK